jgi:apolipoprotein D and lipocalin family protein
MRNAISAPGMKSPAWIIASSAALSGITATYAARADGGIDVLNRGYDTIRGKWHEALGHAYFMRGRDIASLKVSFFGPFYGGYHVFALDPDYQWALVSGPSRKYLWILARQPRLPAELLGQLIETARQAGFDAEALIFPAPRLREAESPSSDATQRS